MMSASPNNARREAVRVAAGESMIHDGQITLYMMQRKADKLVKNMAERVEIRESVLAFGTAPTRERPDTITQDSYNRLAPRLRGTPVPYSNGQPIEDDNGWPLEEPY